MFDQYRLFASRLLKKVSSTSNYWWGQRLNSSAWLEKCTILPHLCSTFREAYLSLREMLKHKCFTAWDPCHFSVSHGCSLQCNSAFHQITQEHAKNPTREIGLMAERSWEMAEKRFLVGKGRPRKPWHPAPLQGSVVMRSVIDALIWIKSLSAARWMGLKMLPAQPPLSHFVRISSLFVKNVSVRLVIL